MTDKKPYAALAALLATACGPNETLYDAHPSDLEGLAPFPSESAGGEAVPAPPASLTPPTVSAPAEGEATTAGELLRAAMDGEFGPLGHVVDEALVTRQDWYGSEVVLLEVTTDDERGDRALVVVRNLPLLFSVGPTDGPRALSDLATVWICGEGTDDDGADWTWDEPQTTGTVEILAVADDVLEYRFDVQGMSDTGRFGRANARASFVRQLPIE